MKKYVSIIIPTFNEEKYLEPTLQGILNQDYDGQYEIIVSDSGSKDRTRDIAQKYTNKIITQEKRGIGVGRNAGAKEAKGEILIFVDADTILIYNTLTEIVKAFNDKRIVGVAIPVLPLSPKTRDIVLFLGFNESVKINTERGKGRARVVGACCAYRKNIFDLVGGFNEKLETLEDFDLSERISKHGKIQYLQETMSLVSTRRIDKWGRIKSVKQYLSLYLTHLISESGIKLHFQKIVDYSPVR